jgi:signal transduction histidine kinase
MLNCFNRCLLTSVLLSAGALSLAAAPETGTLESLSLKQLEQRLSEINSQLGELARYTPRGGFGGIGYRSAEFDGPDHSTTLRIDLAENTPVDQVVLVPAIIRDPVKGFRPDGFPQALRILDENGTVLAERSFTNEHLLRIAPLIIRLDGQPVSSLIVEATRLSPRAFDGKIVFQLAEVLIFNGQTNVALRRPVKASTSPPDPVTAWSLLFLTDGSLPYLMNSAQGSPSRAYLSPRRKPTDALLQLSIDLQKEYPLDQLNLHTVDQSDTIPQGAPDGIGMPHLLLVEGANQADFSDARTLLEPRCDSPFDANPIMMWILSGESYRYIRLTAMEPYIYPFSDGLQPRIGFAEVELFSSGQNVADGKPFVVPGEQRDLNRPALALTDNRNIFGQILPLRQWMEELALRYELETERPLVTAELATHYARQKDKLRRMIWLATLLAAGIGFTILIDRMLRMRQVSHIKERFAADLHDELGANLHTIGLLSELIQRKVGPLTGDAATYLQRIQSVTKQSGIAVRHVTALQSASGIYGQLGADMQRVAKRTLANVEHELTIKGEEFLMQMKPRKRVDLFLFYKECLINICRHSNATQANTHLSADRKHAVLTICDNGSGLSTSETGSVEVPPSLKRRAKLLGATITVNPPHEGEYCVTLQLRLRRWPWR